jgi:hypothetical protein
MVCLLTYRCRTGDTDRVSGVHKLLLGMEAMINVALYRIEVLLFDCNVTVMVQAPTLSRSQSQRNGVQAYLKISHLMKSVGFRCQPWLHGRCALKDVASIASWVYSSPLGKEVTRSYQVFTSLRAQQVLLRVCMDRQPSHTHNNLY